MNLSKAFGLTVLIIGLIVVTSLVSDQNDQKKWLEISDSFQHTFLPDEIAQYTAYLDRQAILNNTDDSEEYEEASLKDLSLENLSKLVLLDRSYKEYIVSEGHLFIDPWTLSVWKESRSQLEIQVSELFISKLALDQNKPRFSAILSHALANKIDISLIILLSALSMSIFLLSVAMRLPHLLAALLIYLSFESFSFIILSQSNDPTLFGSFGLLLCSWTLSIKLALSNQPHLNFLTGKKKLFYLLLMSLLACIYLALSISTEKLSWISMVSAALATLVVLALHHQNNRIEAKERQVTGTNLPSPKKEYRHELAKALDFISRFEFDNAKQTLNILSKKYPSSLTILEQRYHLAKFQPELSTYQELTERLIELSAERNDYKRMLTLFKDIQKTTTSKRRASSFLLPEHYHKMMRVFIEHNDLDKTEQAFHFLELNASDNLKRDACGLLIEKFKSLQNIRKQQQYEMLLQRIG